MGPPGKFPPDGFHALTGGTLLHCPDGLDIHHGWTISAGFRRMAGMGHLLQAKAQPFVEQCKYPISCGKKKLDEVIIMIY
jgi:hypothetical protein